MVDVLMVLSRILLDWTSYDIKFLHMLQCSSTAVARWRMMLESTGSAYASGVLECSRDAAWHHCCSAIACCPLFELCTADCIVVQHTSIVRGKFLQHPAGWQCTSCPHLSVCLHPCHGVTPDGWAWLNSVRYVLSPWVGRLKHMSC